MEQRRFALESTEIARRRGDIQRGRTGICLGSKGGRSTGRQSRNGCVSAGEAEEVAIAEDTEDQGVCRTEIDFFISSCSTEIKLTSIYFPFSICDFSCILLFLLQ